MKKRPQYESGSADEPDYSSDEEQVSKDGKSFEELSKSQNRRQRVDEPEDDVSESSDSGPEETSTKPSHKRRSKHAPAEASAKKPVSVVRDIPGLEKKATSLYRDPRFDATYGRADLGRARKNYAFLNEYREKEVKEMRDQMNKTKNPQEKEYLKGQIKRLQSQLDMLKNQDFERDVISSKKKELRQKYGDKAYLKRSEAKKMVLEERFKHMKKKDLEKSLARKRKKNAAKERKQMPEVRRT